MSLLIALIVQNSHILAGICFILLKNVLDQIEKFLIQNLDLSDKIGKEVRESKTNFSVFCKLVALTLA